MKRSLLKGRLLRAAACALCWSSAVFAGTDEGVSGAQFLRIGASPEASAMGETGAVLSGAQSIFYNPAGLNGLRDGEIYASYAKWIMDTGFSSLAAAKRTRAGVFGIGASYFSVPRIDKYNRYGEKLADDYSVTGLAASAGYAGPITSALSWGAAAKYITSKLEEEKAASFAGDFGLGYAVLPGALDLGFSVQNLGKEIKFNDDGDPLPLTLRFGGRYTIRFDDDPSSPKDLSFLADADRERDAGYYAGFGVEAGMRYEDKARFTVRGGYKTGGIKGAGASLGFGVEAAGFSVDYAYSPLGDLGTAHRLSLTARFGSKDL